MMAERVGLSDVRKNGVDPAGKIDAEGLCVSPLWITRKGKSDWRTARDSN
jgi:hypothetical protein